MKTAHIIKVGDGNGAFKYNYTQPVVAEVSIEVDKQLQKIADPEQKISTDMAVLHSEVDALHIAVSCGESAKVIREECLAVITRLMMVYQKAKDGE